MKSKGQNKYSKRNALGGLVIGITLPLIPILAETLQPGDHPPAGSFVSKVERVLVEDLQMVMLVDSLRVTDLMKFTDQQFVGISTNGKLRLSPDPSYSLAKRHIAVIAGKSELNLNFILPYNDPRFNSSGIEDPLRAMIATRMLEFQTALNHSPMKLEVRLTIKREREAVLGRLFGLASCRRIETYRLDFKQNDLPQKIAEIELYRNPRFQEQSVLFTGKTYDLPLSRCKDANTWRQ